MLWDSRPKQHNEQKADTMKKTYLLKKFTPVEPQKQPTKQPRQPQSTPVSQTPTAPAPSPVPPAATPAQSPPAAPLQQTPTSLADVSSRGSQPNRKRQVNCLGGIDGKVTDGNESGRLFALGGGLPGLGPGGGRDLLDLSHLHVRQAA